ncbi:MAG: hypothetical protein HY919_06175 [Elusimicrobia bacterium]|nr:hypothetical protein [Elusimicrobiota bacterium]
MKEIDVLIKAIRNLYDAVNELQSAFGNRHFTPDGKMVGDIGEAIAELVYDLKIDNNSLKHWDGYWTNLKGEKRKVQIRATQGDWTYLKKPPHNGTFLLIKINTDGTFKTVYNGDIMTVWNKRKHLKSKEKTISLKELEQLNKTVVTSEKIPERKY